MRHMKTSAAGRAMIEQFEGLELTAYQDQGGVWTIGYGHTGDDVHADLVWIKQQADNALKTDLGTVESCINTQVVESTVLVQTQFDALASFTYNEGTEAFSTSTMLKFLNQDQMDQVPPEFLEWVYVGDSVDQGLVNRRQAESDLFATGVYPEGS